MCMCAPVQRLLQVVVTETGWPSAANDMANPTNSRRFTAGVVKASKHGTPLRPGHMDIYLFELLDKCKKTTGETHENHFGLFTIDGKQKKDKGQ